MRKLILATNNIHKIAEMQAILEGLDLEILSARDFPDFPEAEETGETLVENAALKALAVWNKYHLPAVADDTGLEVDYLGGAPGVYSARFAGPACSFADNNRKLLSLLNNVPDEERNARFRCVISFIDHKGELYSVQGILEGSIAAFPRGKQGFGYDPVFVVKGTGKTLAEYPASEKNRISHRNLALARIRPIIIQSLLRSDPLGT
jgi:XTP/dITP diphosphohydrolase